MTREITSELLIDASVDDVWAATIDVESWPRSTPTVTSVERLDPGPLQVGSRARIVQPRQRPAIWTVTELDPPHAFAWETKVLGVTITGVHQLSEAGSGCRNRLVLRLRGRGSSLVGLLLGRTLRKTIETENHGFKRVAEEAQGAGFVIGSAQE